MPSIRGQLRFWWRATAGYAYRDATKLYEAEANVWGDTRIPSSVKLRVLSFKAPVQRKAASTGADGRWTNAEPKYALFPLQENRKEPGDIGVGGSFRLEIFAPKNCEEQVSTALWAWFSFGGIGGRTRRGCGSLYCKDYSYRLNPLPASDGAARAWPVLPGSTALVGDPTDWNSCWRQCMETLQAFRQARAHPRGRSKWPEPDTIRRERSTHAPQHSPVHPEHGFPRGALGLPIIFHFKTPGDPFPDNTLNLVSHANETEGSQELRMASPVILLALVVVLGGYRLIDRLRSAVAANRQMVTLSLKDKVPPASALIAFVSLGPGRTSCLQAATYHSEAAALQHLWLITTREGEGDARWIGEQLSPRFPGVKIHQTQFLDDKDSLEESKALVEHLRKRAMTEIDIPEEQLICDFTGLTKNASAGMILACAPRTARLQYMVPNRLDSGGRADPLAGSHPREVFIQYSVFRED